MPRKTGWAIALGTGLAFSAAAPAQVAAPQVYHANLLPLNSSGVFGEVRLVRDGERLTVLSETLGLEPGQTYAQRLHGLAEGAATCPTLAADTDGDNLIQRTEGLNLYGPPVLALEPFPQATSDRLAFVESYAVGEDDLTVEALDALPSRAIVIYGATVGGVFDPTLPVACGRLRTFGADPLSDEGVLDDGPLEAEPGVEADVGDEPGLDEGIVDTDPGVDTDIDDNPGVDEGIVDTDPGVDTDDEFGLGDNTTVLGAEPAQPRGGTSPTWP